MGHISNSAINAVCSFAALGCPNRFFNSHGSDGLMRGDKKIREPEYVFLMNEIGPPNRQEVNVQTYRGIRTRTHTYAVQLDGRWCLYDNVAAPTRCTTSSGIAPTSRSSISSTPRSWTG